MPRFNDVMSNNAPRVMRRLWAAGLSVAISVTLAGCFAHARGELVYDHPVEYVEAAPARVEDYPRTDYHGRPAYLVDGRWYYTVNQRWVVFREEPTELREYRVRRAPAHAAPGRGYGRYSQALSAPRSSHRHLADSRAKERREEQRRMESRRRAERREDMQRAERHRRAERRANEDRRKAERREEQEAAERRAERRRNDDDRGAEHRAQGGQRLSQRGDNDSRDRPRARRDRRKRDDEPTKHQRRRDHDD
jgi:hypothetical protein